MRKPARQGSKLAGKGAYMDVSDRNLQVQLTPEAKIASDFYLVRAIFAFAGFVSALKARMTVVTRACLFVIQFSSISQPRLRSMARCHWLSSRARVASSMLGANSRSGS